MKTIALIGAGALLALTLCSCVNEVFTSLGSDEGTPGVYYTTNYDYYTRYDNYLTPNGNGFYSYGGRYEGGGYGYGDPLNH